MSAPIAVRRAVAIDAEALSDVHVRVWRWAYRDLMPADVLARLRPERRADGWRADLAGGWIDTWVAVSSGEVEGFARFAVTRDEDAPPDAVELVMINRIHGAALPQLRSRECIT